MADDDIKRKSLENTYKWKKANPEKVRASRRRWYHKHKEAIKINYTAWRIANKDKMAAIAARRKQKSPDSWRKVEAAAKARDPEKFQRENREKAKRSYHKNLEKNRQKSRDNLRRLRIQKPEMIREINRAAKHKRRAQKSGSQEHYTKAQISALRDKCGDKCAYCGERGKMHIDHIIPLAKGGSNAISNIQLICGRCNSEKGASDPVDFARRKGFLI